jgi:hypothetical protein
MSEYKLSQEIISLSEANTWDHAKLEWDLDQIYTTSRSNPKTCLCGHYPILEICELLNQENGNTAIVGNHCVNKFRVESDKIFRAVDRIRGDITKPLNVETIAHANDKGWIDDWDKDFYIDTWRKRKPSHKQMSRRVKINQIIIHSMQE